MSTGALVLLGGLVLLVAALYSTVGHGGASGYLAVMALVGVSVTVMRPTALLLNVLVASISLANYTRAGFFRWRLLWPFAITSAPAAYFAARVQLPVVYVKMMIGLTLLFSAWRLWGPMGKQKGAAEDTIRSEQRVVAQETKPPHPAAAMVIGAVLGTVAGLTGVGGGIFLSPLLLLLRWAGVKETAATSAAFILINSLAGLAGLWWGGKSLTPEVWHSVLTLVVPLAGCALVGGLVGGYLGSSRLTNTVVRRVLAAVLVTAGVKLITG